MKVGVFLGILYRRNPFPGQKFRPNAQILFDGVIHLLEQKKEAKEKDMCGKTVEKNNSNRKNFARNERHPVLESSRASEASHFQRRSESNRKRLHLPSKRMVELLVQNNPPLQDGRINFEYPSPFLCWDTRLGWRRADDSTPEEEAQSRASLRTGSAGLGVRSFQMVGLHFYSCAVE